MKQRMLKGTPLALLSVLAAATTPLRAQVAPSPTPEAEEDTTIELSPFVVETSQDEGKYRATETLGGARIRTNLRDIAAPFSVITSQFLQDTASNNNQDLLTYTTGTEVGGLLGNWGGFGNSQGVSDRGALLSPNQNTRVRGLDQADNTRNFFLTDIPWDSYNVERVEIQRGPNSILFGVGSPAGIINANTIQARFDDNGGRVENQFSKFGSLRWVGDYNVEVVDDLLAVRFAGLINNQKFRQEPAFNDDRRGYVTATFQPQVLPEAWAGKLVVRASYERASVEGNRPRILPPEDGISLWFEDAGGDGVNDKIGFGQRVYDPFLWSQGGGGDATRGIHSAVSGTVLNPLPYQPAVAAIDGGALNNGGVGFFYRNGESRPFFTSRQSPRAFPGALAADGSVDNAIGILYATPLRVGGMNSYAVSVDRIDELEGRPSRFPLASRGYYKDQSLTDPTIFDFYNHLIDGDNKREHQKWDAFNVSLAQTFLDNRIGVEYVYDEQSYSEWRQGSTWDRPYISVDINKNLQHQLSQYSRTADDLLDTSSYSVYGFTPSESQPYANPMAGAAFVAGSFDRNNRLDRDRENHRLTVTGELRATDFLDRQSVLARILGRHVFTGLLSREDRKDAVTQWVPAAVPYDWAYSLSMDGENTALGEAPRGITPVIYMSEPLFGRSSATGLNLGPMQTYYNPSGAYSVDYFQTTWLPSRDPSDPDYVDPAAPWTDFLGAEGVQADNPFNYTGRTNAQLTMLSADSGDIDQLVTNYGVTEQTVESKGLVWQGHLLDGAIVPTVGWREDKLATYTATGARDAATGISSRRVGETERVLDNTGRTNSWGVVAHLPSRWLENVPVLSGISAYYNHGENNRVEARYNYDGEPLANPSAESKDYGIVLSAFDDKLNIKVGKYETKVKGANLPGGSSILGSNQYYLYNLEAWGTANTLLYAFGHAGLDPNQSWHWNHALVDDNAWGNENTTYAPNTDLFRNHPSTQNQLAAMDAWMEGIDAQFFDNYDINADVEALKSAYQTWRTSGNIQPLVDAAAASGFNVGTYTTGFASQNNGQINGISPNGTIDNTSEGYEVEIDYTPVPNWNIKINAAKTNAYRESLGQPMLDFIDQQWSKLQGPAGDLRLWWGGDNPLRRYYADNIISAVEFQKESIGFQVPELRPWRFSGVTNYSFTEGRLKGFNFGGAYRWEDKQILGYGLKNDLSGLDVHKPIYGEIEDHIDLWAGYQRKLTDQIMWRLQLNLRNVGENVGLTPISVNPDGAIAAQRITEGMSWSVTNTFYF